MSNKNLSNQEKLQVLLPHWLEHNKSHAQEFCRWAEILRGSGEQDASRLLEKAVKKLRDADLALGGALELLGGSLVDADHHHHHHHDE